MGRERDPLGKPFPERAPPVPAAPPEPEHKPYIASAVVLPELTIKVFVVGILLSWIMASANAYLGLYAALTVSAAIPASVISMAVLRFFKKRNILENNLIQTTASAGESVAAGIVFVLPALLFVGYWKEIGFVETFLIAALGGSLGVLFTIPLRRAFIVDAKLQYPEGVATVSVLKSGEKGSSGGIGYIVVGGLVGAAYKFMGGGLALWSEVAEWGRKIGNWGVYMGSNLAPALLGVGFIVGLRIASLIFIGGMISYAVAIPIYLAINGWPAANPSVEEVVAIFGGLRSSHIRFLGAGAMAAGGVFTLIRLRGALARGIRSGLDAYRAMRTQGADTRIRTERDITMRTVLIALAVFVVPLTALFTYFVSDQFRDLGPGLANLWIGLLLGVVMILAGFVFSAVAGYMAGVVGSSNNPISGTAIGAILFTALLLLLLQVPGEVGAAATILIGATIASAAAIAGDNMQDLKAGHLLGGTPKNLQIMQMVGAMAAALVLPFVLLLLDSGYGIGVHAECNPDSTYYDAASEYCRSHPLPLQAPQASLMATISQGILGTGAAIPWEMFWMGVGVAFLLIGLDTLQQMRGSSFRIPVMAVAVGMYLPLATSTPIFLGGLIAFFAARAYSKRVAVAHPESSPLQRERALEHRMSYGILFSSGLIAGESLIGIVLAGLLVAGGRDAEGNAVNPVGVFSGPTWFIGGTLLFLYIGFLVYYSVIRRAKHVEDLPPE